MLGGRGGEGEPLPLLGGLHAGVAADTPFPPAELLRSLGGVVDPLGVPSVGVAAPALVAVVVGGGVLHEHAEEPESLVGRRLLGELGGALADRVLHVLGRVAVGPHVEEPVRLRGVHLGEVARDRSSERQRPLVHPAGEVAPVASADPAPPPPVGPARPPARLALHLIHRTW